MVDKNLPTYSFALGAINTAGLIGMWNQVQALKKENEELKNLVEKSHKNLSEGINHINNKVDINNHGTVQAMTKLEKKLKKVRFTEPLEAPPKERVKVQIQEVDSDDDSDEEGSLEEIERKIRERAAVGSS